ncbi:hypothetical protein [Planomonospora venezuelensis]|uniref:hypothetical protein n=1 Tax=Planomonospora venezuelensis TaxID=1999 RepID=UPI0031E7D703
MVATGRIGRTVFACGLFLLGLRRAPLRAQRDDADGQTGEADHEASGAQHEPAHAGPLVQILQLGRRDAEQRGDETGQSRGGQQERRGRDRDDRESRQARQAPCNPGRGRLWGGGVRHPSSVLSAATGARTMSLTRYPGGLTRPEPGRGLRQCSR